MTVIAIGVKKLMLKQFNLSTLSFRDPVGEDAEWINIETQTQIDEISASITNGGAVWMENGEIRCSGKAPSEFTFLIERQNSLSSQKKSRRLFFLKKKRLY